MSDHATEIDVAGAQAALEERLAPTRETIEVARGDHGRFAPRPADESATPAAGEAEAEVPGATPAGETPAQQTPTEDVPSFTHIPDEALTPELLAVKRSMQADYTKKTQEVAQLRQLREEYGFQSDEDMKGALEAYKTLADPNNWPRLHQELTQYLQSQGLPAHVASEAAGVALGDAVSDVEIPDLDMGGGVEDFEDDDGASAALAAQVRALQQNQQQLVELIQQDRRQRVEEAQIAQLAYQMTQDEQTIRASHKDLDEGAMEEYIEAVYDLAGDQGDLFAAANRLDSMLGRQASAYLVSKESARQVPSAVPGAGVIASEEEEPPHTLEEGHARAMAFVARQEAAQRQAGL